MTPQLTGTFVLLGTVTKAHGLRGELKVHPFTETPGNFSRYRQLYLSADHGKSRVPYTNIQARVSGEIVILRLAECTSRDQAEQLRGMEIWLASSDLPPLAANEFYLHTLEGKVARTTGGRLLGTVVGILNNGGQDIVVIRQGETEYLVPAVRHFLVTIDDDTVVLDLPPGLLEINS